MLNYKTMGKTTVPVEAKQAKAYATKLWNKTEQGSAYWVSRKAEALMVLMAIDTGYRISDLLQVKWSNCEVAEIKNPSTLAISTTYTIRIKQAKTKKEIANKVTPHTANLMNEYRKVLASEGVVSEFVISNTEGKPYHRQWAIKRMKRASESGEMGDNATEGVGVHSLRKAAAIRMLNAPNGTIERVSNYLGHTSVRTTEKYLRVNEKAQEQWQDNAISGF